MVEKMVKRYIEELAKTKRSGIDDLVRYLETSGFFEAPCSTRYHLAQPYGLLQHSLNVLDYARKLNEAWGRVCGDDSIILVSLLHDIGKAGYHAEPFYTENVLKSGKPAAQPYKQNGKIIGIPHECISMAIAERYISLTVEEHQAILFHNGQYGDFRYALQNHETPLYLILHASDMWCSRVVEIEDENEGKEE